VDLADLRRRPVGHHHDAIGQQHRLVHVVRDHQHGVAELRVDLHDLLLQVRARERKLAARRVVLLEAADRREQAAAFRVIEILGGYGLLGQGEPRDDVLAKAVRGNHRTGKN